MEKNEQAGGRNWQLKEAGFTFDMGPSWLLMPDVFEHFFEGVGERLSDHLQLTKLSPSYRLFFADRPAPVDIFPGTSKVVKTFENLQAGSGVQIEKYLQKEAIKYEIAMKRFLYKNYNARKEFLTPELLTKGLKLNVLSMLNKNVGGCFPGNPHSQQILTFPSLFLGTSPYHSPALYGILNHSLLAQGVFYPKGGLYKITELLSKISKQNGVKTLLNYSVEKILIENGQAVGVKTKDGEQKADVIISNAGIEYTEKALMPPSLRDHTARYWQKIDRAPSALLIYLGVGGKLPSLAHHNLFFNPNWQQNFKEIEDSTVWPSQPNFYVSKPSQTDASLAPSGHEALSILVPIAAGLSYTTKQISQFADKVLKTLGTQAGVKDLQKRIVYQKLFAVEDFKERFNAPEGTALGLAHTLRQTAFFRPNNVSKKVKNLYYVGADTRPGIGLPMTLISAELVYERLRAKG